jgi:drug/metabolite transporter (DMT)-like permease
LQSPTDTIRTANTSSFRPSLLQPLQHRAPASRAAHIAGFLAAHPSVRIDICVENGGADGLSNINRAGHGARAPKVADALGGAAVLILHGEVEALAELRFNAGDLWMLGAVCLWAVYSVLLRSRPAQVPPLALHTASVGAGALWMLPLFSWEAARGGGLPTDVTVWLAIGFIAVFSSAIAHAMWVRGVATIGANRASVFIHLMPLFGALLAITFLGEQLATYHAVGAALVLGGVVLTSRR